MSNPKKPVLVFHDGFFGGKLYVHVQGRIRSDKHGWDFPSSVKYIQMRWLLTV